MNRSTRIILGLTIFSMMLLVLIACTKSAEPTATSLPQPTIVKPTPTDTPAAAAPAIEATAYPAPPTPEPQPTVVYPAPSSVDAEKLLQEKLGGCHGMERITSQHMTAAEWRETLLRMREKGAKLTDEEIEILVQYLAANYGK